MGFKKTLTSLVLAGVLAFVGGAKEAKADYDRPAAYSYATAYAYNVVSDGYFWDNSSTPNSYLPGQTLTSTQMGPSGFDCAHFVSCCIGNEPNDAGGGLNVPSRGGSYGEPGAENLINWLLGRKGYTNKYAIPVDSISKLEIGDVIGYDKIEEGTQVPGIDHVALHVGSGYMTAHSSSHQSEYWNLYYPSNKYTYTFVHIIPEPSTIGLLSLGALAFRKSKK